MGDIKVGDRVIAQTGEPTIVTGVFRRGEKIFRVVMSDGSSASCDEHLSGSRRPTETRVRTPAARELGKLGLRRPSPGALRIRATTAAPHLGAKNHNIPIVGSVQFDPQTVPLDPWLIGFLIGDGCFVGKSSPSRRRTSKSRPRPAPLYRMAAVEHSDRCNLRISGGRPHLIHPMRCGPWPHRQKSAESMCR